MSIFIGIDPGLNGAIAVLNASPGVIIHDMPTLEVSRGGKAKREVSAQLLSDIIGGVPGQITMAVLERVGAMPGQGVTSVFSFGRSVGIIEGVLAALDIPTTIVTPQAWQKAMGVRRGKDGARQRASELLPAYAGLFALKKHDGRADAALMALYAERLA